MTRQGLAGLGADDIDLAILENVGNLVCPAEFDTGAVKNAMILSVPEGHDKPLKYPLMFTICDAVIINKIDVMPYFDFDLEKCRSYILRRNPTQRYFRYPRAPARASMRLPRGCWKKRRNGGTAKMSECTHNCSHARRAAGAANFIAMKALWKN